ncbi:aminomethyl-transferring glycine dehydrogenase subunit GcvPB [Microbacterium pseudoresistens]|uniref:glycine dehydrogenase (aminomethyl-transferring) n=1 Tax=Microbacterium pseudoresistens TaxID=640634 RepID=A0A7Y9EX27_9MICO|nr:aminomethyl-transferring glycine dehydrogenase subunit GcvPB [Microbacterium pseudoresistens]NYD54635.1 glycine dehydrogenase subunit 2 [Microbacterium pseudoresistens]
MTDILTARTPLAALSDQEGRTPRDYHAARWNEPLIFALGSEGERGVRVPLADPAALEALSRGAEAAVRRARPTALPEVGQAQVLRHFLRLSQETLGADLNVDIGQGTCTMKYSPKVNEEFAGAAQSVETHPLQHPSTVQGTLEILHELERAIASVSGMDAVSLQAGAGSAAIWGNVQIVRAYHADRGEGEQRDEVVTTIFSHPSNAATAKTAGYRVVTLYPGDDGLIELDALRAALSERTAALLITNPEDTGIFNPAIAEIVAAAHEVGALCVYDQANANGILGITRAREAGFDLCHFNLHKTFSTPHACGGPAAGAIGATAELEPFLPGPRLVRGEDGFRLEDRGPRTTAPIRPFWGVVPNLIRAYAWIRALGAEGLREVAEIAVLNNNYVMSRLSEVEGVRPAYLEGAHPPIEQVRYSWDGLARDTGVTSGELGQRLADFGMHLWTSHHPYVVPDPATIEPTEAYARRELDEYVDALRQASAEAREDPEFVRRAPYKSSIHHVDAQSMTDPETWATSWRAYRRKYLGEDVRIPAHWSPSVDSPTRERQEKLFHR